MNEYHLLTTQLSNSLKWNQARLKLLSLFILGIIHSRTVNLSIISESFCGYAQSASHYKRIQRFLRFFTINFKEISELIANWILPDEDKWLLCLDRTNWKYGQTNINILVLSVAVDGTSIPLFWTMLDKQGNSNTEERIDLLNQFLEQFGVEKISCLTADREFKGKKWLKFLKEKQIPFCLRIAVNTKINNRHDNQILPVTRLFNLKMGEKMTLNKSRKIWGGQVVHLACFRTADSWVIVICAQAPHKALEHYQQRWKIETLFQALKGRGFNLEDTHLQNLERINKLFAVITLAFVWCYKVGVWRNNIIPIKTKSHQRLAKSIFRYGVEWIRKLLNNMTQFADRIRKLIFLVDKKKIDLKKYLYLFDLKLNI